MALPENHKRNFETLRQAFLAGDAALVECREKATGKVRAVICAIVKGEETVEITPFGHLCDGNPFEEYAPPLPSGGFEGDQK